jgi:hypothetical protein
MITEKIITEEIITEEKMMVGMHSRPSSGRDAALLRKPKEVMKIVHIDVQCTVTLDIIQIIYLMIYTYVLLVSR